MDNSRWLAFAERMLHIRFQLLFLIFVNAFLVVWIIVNDSIPHPFDPFPYNLLNLILAWFLAVMDILILIAQGVVQQGADKQAQYTLANTEATLASIRSQQEATETIVAVVRVLEEMGEKEYERDLKLHQMLEQILRKP